MYSQMYLRGAIEELKFIEQNIIQIKNGFGLSEVH
jgi:hypothetical protein